jgi:hypothetical protein
MGFALCIAIPHQITKAWLQLVTQLALMPVNTFFPLLKEIAR